MKSKLVLAAAALAALGAPLDARQAGGAPAHNVLVIVLDDVGTDMIGAYESYERGLGRPAGVFAETPAIDQLLAAQGVSFAAAWASPKCSPTRAQILTGMFGRRTGIGSIVRTEPFSGARNPGLNADTTLLPQQLAAAPAPYASAAIGKWHLGDIDQFEADPAHPLGWPYGTWFDYYAGSRFNLESVYGPGSGNTYFSWRKSYASALPQHAPCGLGNVSCEAPALAPPAVNYATVDTTEDALAMMSSLPQPWLLYVSYNAIHSPYHVPPSGLPAAPCLPGGAMAQACELGVNAGPVDLARCMMRALDQQIGRLVCAANPADTTIVLIGDNGTPQAAITAPFNPLHGKGTLYEGGVRVPLLIRSPLVPPARRGSFEPRLVSAVDVHATLLEVAGLPPRAGADGRSLSGYLASASAPSVRSTNYTEGFFPNFKPLPSGGPPPNYVCNFHNQALRDGRFKLIRRTSRDHANPALTVVREEFYDLAQGGPPDTSSGTPVPTPDWFEEFDLLASGAPLQGDAREAYGRLTRLFATRYPSLVR